MSEAEDELAEWVDRLSVLPRPRCLAFAATACVRLIPCYQACSMLERKGDALLLERSLSAAWECIEKGLRAGGSEVSELVGPHLDDQVKAYGSFSPLDYSPEAYGELIFESLLAGQAECALYAVESLLRGCLEGNEAEYVGRVADASLEAVYNYCRTVNDVSFGYARSIPDPGVDIFGDYAEDLPLMVEERAWLSADYQRLLSENESLPSLLADLREAARSAGIRPFRRGLIWLPMERWAELKQGGR